MGQERGVMPQGRKEQKAIGGEGPRTDRWPGARAHRSALAGGDGPAPTGRAAEAAERRQAILAAALDEFMARGFAATRLDDVAKRAGVAKGTIYLHFAGQGIDVPGD